MTQQTVCTITISPTPARTCFTPAPAKDSCVSFYEYATS